MPDQAPRDDGWRRPWSVLCQLQANLTSSLLILLSFPLEASLILHVPLQNYIKQVFRHSKLLSPFLQRLELWFYFFNGKGKENGSIFFLHESLHFAFLHFIFWHLRVLKVLSGTGKDQGRPVGLQPLDAISLGSLPQHSREFQLPGYDWHMLLPRLARGTVTGVLFFFHLMCVYFFLLFSCLSPFSCFSFSFVSVPLSLCSLFALHPPQTFVLLLSWIMKYSCFIAESFMYSIHRFWNQVKITFIS